MEVILLLMMAVIPPAAFMYFIYWMDRHEPECMRTILAAMFVGALSTIPAIIIQLAFENVAIFNFGGIAGPFFESFLLVAPSEEFFKFLFIFLYLRRKHFYDEINDGIVFYGAGALGFALLENIFYVLDYGLSVGLLRAVTSIPIHTFCGIIIGYHAGLARFTEQNRPVLLIFRGLFIAYITHALFNTLVMAESALFLLFFPLVVLVYFAGFKLLGHGRMLSVAGSKTTIAVYNSPPPPAPVPPPPPLPPVVNYREAEVSVESDGRRYLPPKKEVWKAVIARVLLAIAGLIWLLAFVGDDSPSTGRVELLLGLIIITILPFMVGTLLEVSYRRRKKIKIYLD